MKNITEPVKSPEQILVAPEQSFPLIHFKNGWLDGVDEEVLNGWLSKSFFMDRPAAETNPKFKQFIPYCVLTQGGKFYSYQRTKKGGEKRLHELYSLGCGGHICDLDGKAATLDTFWEGFTRELKEEVGLDTFTGQILGAIYDDSTPVNSVHVGICHLVIVPEKTELKIPDHALPNGSFETLDMICKNIDMFEGWSQIIIKNKVLESL